MSETNESQLVARFDKNVAEEIQVHLCKWKAQMYVDLRVWYRPEVGDDGGLHPTTKGIRINAELLPDLIQALKKAQRTLEDGPEVEIVRDDNQEAGW